MPNFSAILPWYVVAMLAALLSSGCASLPTGVQRPVSTALAAPETTPMGQWVQSRKASAGARSNSAFFLLETEELALSARVALVDGARKTLDLQYYAIHADASTETVLDRLRSAAQRGVRVRLLLDDLNTVGRDAQVLRLAFEPNVQIRLFNPIPGHRASLLGRLLGALPDISRLQKRMHNKLFLADNALGIIGGRNLGDAYFGQDKTTNFVDIDVLAAGRIVRDMSVSFDSYWNSEQAYPVQSLVTGAELEALRQPPSANAGEQTTAVPVALAIPGAEAATKTSKTPPEPGAPALTPVASVTTGTRTTVLPDVTASFALESLMNLKQLPLTWAPSMLLADQPGKIALEEGVGTGNGGDDGATVIDGMLTLMDKAKRDLLIVSPYFVPGHKMMLRFAALRTRGVTIEPDASLGLRLLRRAVAKLMRIQKSCWVRAAHGTGRRARAGTLGPACAAPTHRYPRRYRPSRTGLPARRRRCSPPAAPASRCAHAPGPAGCGCARMAAQLALLDAPGQGPLQQGRRGQGDSSLVSSSARPGRAAPPGNPRASWAPGSWQTR
jgi:putative cardiolipin synthase